MHKFVRSLITEWRRLDLPFEGETVVVAVSGGADSTSLLLAIHDLVQRKKLRHRFMVAHFNHKLRGRERDSDESFVKKLAERLDLPFTVGAGRLSTKGNLEQNARDARYKFLLQTAKEYGAFAILTAHTQNDQAETVLFNLIRGSGPGGLAGMRPTRELDDRVMLIRPLLSWARRDDTEAFCRELNEKFRIDRMNRDEQFSRVRIRRDILPRLAVINPRIIETLARTAELMPLPAVNSETNCVPSENLQIAKLKTLEQPELYSVLRDWLKGKRGSLRSLELKHIEAIGRLIHSRKSGNTVELPRQGRVVKHGGTLRFENIKVEK